MIFKFNKETLDILHSCGWSKDRDVNTDDYELHFSETNQPLSKMVIAFLQSFGGVKIEGMTINPVEAYNVLGELVRKRYEKWIGKKLCLVGLLDQSALLMTVKGEIYSAWSGYVHFWGATIEDAFDNILVNKNFITIPVPKEMLQSIPEMPQLNEIELGIKFNSGWNPVIQMVTIKGIDFEMCKVPRGSFRMGDDGKSHRSKPAHYQFITRPYWVSVNLVTNSQWQQAVSNSFGAVKKPQKTEFYDDSDKENYPVVWVNWYQCQDFVNWLGEEWRLPTELEWEFAVRGPDSLIDPLNGHPQGETWVGARDTVGHIWEWTSSLFKGYPYNPTDGRENLIARANRTIRNAGWKVNNNPADASARLGKLSSYAYKNVGMRLCTTEL